MDMDLIESQLEILFKKHYALKESIDQNKSYDNDTYESIQNDINGIHKRICEFDQMKKNIYELQDKYKDMYPQTNHYINQCYAVCSKTRENVVINDRIYLGHIYILYFMITTLICIELFIYNINL